jgi:protein gp37
MGADSERAVLMGKTTDISWTDHTFNPHWGCFKVSPGCTNCYAETFAKRVGQQIWGPPKTTERRLFGDKHWAEPLHWNAEAEKAGERRRVFCASMADVFEDHPQLPPVRRRLWNLIEDTPYLDWLLLTKRPENIATMLPQKYWPNVWLGTSTEDQQRADERVPVLLRYRDLAPVLFLSVEPMLGPIDLSIAIGDRVTTADIDWCIVGGESGPRHRPFDTDWARSLRDQCAAADIAYFFKQHGGRTHAEGGCLLDGREHKAFPEPRRELAHA